VGGTSVIGSTTGGERGVGRGLRRAGGSIAGLAEISPLPNGARLNLNLGSLFSFAAPGSAFLVQSSGAFANENDLLSSSYFLNLLGINPATPSSAWATGCTNRADRPTTDDPDRLAADRRLHQRHGRVPGPDDGGRRLRKAARPGLP
jgi:hypothetical protein